MRDDVEFWREQLASARRDRDELDLAIQDADAEIAECEDNLAEALAGAQTD